MVVRKAEGMVTGKDGSQSPVPPSLRATQEGAPWEHCRGRRRQHPAGGWGRKTRSGSKFSKIDKMLRDCSETCFSFSKQWNMGRSFVYRTKTVLGLQEDESSVFIPAPFMGCIQQQDSQL